MAVSAGTQGRTLFVYEANTGKLAMPTLQAKQMVAANLTCDGLLVTLADGDLEVRDVKKLSDPVWTRKYAFGGQNKMPRLLGVGCGIIAVSPDLRSGKVEVLPFAGPGEKVTTFTLDQTEDKPQMPVSASITAKGIFVVCSQGQQMYQPNLVTMCQGLNIQKYDLVKNAVVWNQTIVDDPQMPVFPAEMETGLGHIVVTPNHRQVAYTEFQSLVISGETGRIVDKIDLFGKNVKQDVLQRRLGIMATPAMTDGRLVVETTEGIKVYGGK